MTVKATRPYAAVQMIDTSVVRVHQHGASVAANSKQLMGRSRGGLTTKIHAVVDGSGLPVRIALTTGETHDNRLVFTLLSGLKSGAMLLADRGFDADWIRGTRYSARRLGEHPCTVRSVVKKISRLAGRLPEAAIALRRFAPPPRRGSSSTCVPQSSWRVA